MCIVMFYLKKPGIKPGFFFYLYIILMNRSVESKKTNLF